MATITVGMRWGNGFAVELGEKNMRDGVVDRLGSLLEQIGQANVEASFTKADRGVERSEAAETDVEGRDGGARSKRAVLLLKDGDKGLRSGKGGAGSLWRGLGRRAGRRVEEHGRLRSLRKKMQELTQSGAGLIRGAQRDCPCLGMTPDKEILFEDRVRRMN